MSDLFDEFAASKILIDRSDLETCANCPMQMRLLRERKRTVGNAANVPSWWRAAAANRRIQAEPKVHMPAAIRRYCSSSEPSVIR